MKNTSGLKPTPSLPEAEPGAPVSKPVSKPPRIRLARSARLPHVCFVAPAAWPVLCASPDIKLVGGAEVQQSVLARALAARGYRVSMICLDFGQPDEAQVDGVTVYKTFKFTDGLPVVRFVYPRLTSVWNTLRRVNADIYYQRSSSMLTAVVARFCRSYGKRSIYAGASDVDFLPGKQQIEYRRDRWLYEYGLRRVDSVIAQNPGQVETCLQHYGRRPVHIPSCYAPPRGARADDMGTVLWVGTIRDYKQPELLIELARRLPQHRFVMVGGRGYSTPAGEKYYRSVEEAARQLPNLEFAGFVPLARVEDYFNQARLFVNTSRYEGFPNTFLQAWARGVPTVSFIDTGSRDGGQPVNSVVPDVSQAASEISRLMLDDDHWRVASSRCQSYFQANHSVDAVVSRYAQLFSQLGARQ